MAIIEKRMLVPSVNEEPSDGLTMFIVGPVSASTVTYIVANPVLLSVSVTFAVIVWLPVESEVVVKDAVSFAIEPSILEYQSRLEARPGVKCVRNGSRKCN